MNDNGQPVLYASLVPAGESWWPARTKSPSSCMSQACRSRSSTASRGSFVTAIATDVSIRALIAAAAEHRLGAAVALLFLQGWRVSEVLGLAWEDLDLDGRTALVRRASVYVDGHGQRLGPTKTEGARGEHWLLPTVVRLLLTHQQRQDQEGASAPW